MVLPYKHFNPSLLQAENRLGKEMIVVFENNKNVRKY